MGALARGPCARRSGHAGGASRRGVLLLARRAPAHQAGAVGAARTAGAGGGLTVRQLARGLALLLVAVVSLQLFFVARVALMRWVDPQSTTFQRSEWWRLQVERGPRFDWRQHWV